MAKMAKMGCRVKMAGNGFPRVIRRGSQVDNGRNGLPRENGRKWIAAGKMAGNGFPRVL